MMRLNLANLGDHGEPAATSVRRVVKHGPRGKLVINWSYKSVGCRIPSVRFLIVITLTGEDQPARLGG